MRRLAHRGERLEKGFEDARLAQSPEPFPDAVPVAELSGKRAPVDVVNGKIVKRFEEFSVIASFVAPSRARCLEYFQDIRPILIGHSLCSNSISAIERRKV